MYAKSAKQILSKINCDKLALVRGEGYWYFVYDTFEATKVYETKSVYCCYLNQMSLDHWVEEGKDFVEQCKQLEIQKASEEPKPVNRIVLSLKKGIY